MAEMTDGDEGVLLSLFISRDYFSENLSRPFGQEVPCQLGALQNG